MILANGVELEEGYKSNRNVLVLGVPGSGKTRGHVLPNLMEMSGSFIILDPKGEIYANAANMLRKRGYKVQMLDLMEPSSTKDFYNPLAHIRTQDDIVKFTSLMTAEERRTTSDAFWPNSAKLLLNALTAFALEALPEQERNLMGIGKLLNLCTSKEEDSTEKTNLETLFDILEERNPDSYAVKEWRHIEKIMTVDRTFMCIIMSAISTVAPYMSPGMEYLSGKNTVDFASLGREDTALFIKSSDTDRSRDPFVSVLFQQAIDTLCIEAEKQDDQMLKNRVHLFMDDFGTNLHIERFDSLIAGMRSRGISASVILQSEGQLKDMFGYSWTTILGSCDSFVFLGSNDLGTCKEVSLRLNRPLEEVLYKRKEDIYVFSQGRKPITARLYDIRQHERYADLDEAIRRNRKNGMSI